MAIKIRADLSAALTKAELDTNFTEFFYSSSVDAAQENLTLHYTGSSGLGIGQNRKHTIPLNPYTGSLPPAVGNVGEVQIKGGSGFAADSDFKWDTTNNALILNSGTVQAADGLLIKDKNIRLKSSASPNTTSKLILHGNGANKSGSIAYNTGGNESIVFRNETNTSTAGKNNIEFYFRRISSANPAVAFYGNDSSITLGYANKSIANLNISGSVSIQGNQASTTRLAKLFSFEAVNRINDASSNPRLKGNDRGFILEGPETGHVVIGLHGQDTGTGAEGFAIISSPTTGSNHSPTYNKTVLVAQGNGNVGIGTNNPSKLLHVEGDVLVTGNTTLGNGTSDDTQVTGDLDVDVNLNVDGNAVIDGTVTLSTLANATSNNYNYVVRETNGNLTKQVIAAPIPVGGIIMWSGNMNAIPSGFALCDGGTHNNVQTPDLRNKFIVGGSNSGASAAPTTTVSGSATASGGSATHNHGGNTGAHTLTTSQIPAHGHAYKDGYFCEVNNPGLGNGGAKDFVDDLGASHFKGSGKSDTDNRFIYGRNMTTSDTGGGGSHTHTIATQTNVPPFYALAYIMFVG